MNDIFNKHSSINPITPIGFGKLKAYEYPMTRFIDYTLRDWRIASDQLINSSMGMLWSQLVTWMLSSDPLVRSLVDRRINPIKSIEWSVQDERGEIVEDWTEELCKKKVFLDLLEYIMLSVFEGFTLFQFDIDKMIANKFPIELIDYKKQSLKVRFADPEGKFDVNTYSNLFFVQHSQYHQTILGLYQPIALEYIRLATARKNWDSYSQNVAVPSRVIYYNASVSGRDYQYDDNGEPIIDPDTNQPLYKEENKLRGYAQELAKNYNSTDVLVLPRTYDKVTGNIVDDIAVEATKDGNAQGAAKHNVFKDNVKICEDRIIKCVLGAILTINEGSGTKALGDVHLRILKEIQESDIRFVSNYLNTIFKKKIGMPEQYNFCAMQVSNLNIDDAVKISNIAKNIGKTLTDDFFNKIGVPKEYVRDVKDNTISEPINTTKKVKEKVKEKKEVLKFGFLKTEIEEEVEEEVDVPVTEYFERLVAPSESKRNYKYYKLLPSDKLMELSKKVEISIYKKSRFNAFFSEMLVNSDGDFVFENEKLKKDIFLKNLSCVDNIAVDLLKECCENPNEIWKLGKKYSLLKFYQNVVYKIKVNVNIIEYAGPLNNFLDVEDSRKGSLIE